MPSAWEVAHENFFPVCCWVCITLLLLLLLRLLVLFSQDAQVLSITSRYHAYITAVLRVLLAAMPLMKQLSLDVECSR